MEVWVSCHTVFLGCERGTREVSEKANGREGVCVTVCLKDREGGWGVCLPSRFRDPAGEQWQELIRWQSPGLCVCLRVWGGFLLSLQSAGKDDLKAAWRWYDPSISGSQDKAWGGVGAKKKTSHKFCCPPTPHFLVYVAQLEVVWGFAAINT